MESHVEVTDAGPCRKVVRIEADWSAVEPEYVGVVSAFATAAEVPGFRKGRAPKGLVEKRYVKAIAEETRDAIVPKLYRDALSREKIHPVAIVDVRDARVIKGQSVSFEVTVDVAPEFTLPSYKGIPVKSEAIAASAEAVEAAYLRLVDGYSRYVDVTGRSLQRGDMAMITYSGKCEGKPVETAADGAGLGEGKDFWVLAGEPEYLPGLTDGITGMSMGETRTLMVHFPADYHVKAFGSKDVEYTITLTALREKRPPEINAEFLKPFGVDSVESLKGRIREDMLRAAEEREAGRRQDVIARHLLSGVDIQLPQSIVEQETNNAIRNMVRRISAQGATRQQLAEHRETILETASKGSTDRVKLGYILSRIAEEEKIAVSDEDVDERVAVMAARHQMGVAELRSQLEKRNAMEGLRSEIQAERTMAWLLEQATITE
jgi:trigger factor